MLSGSTLLPLLSLLLILQAPQESIKERYEAAEAQRRAGNLAAAEAEYTAILGVGYARLGRIYAAQGKHRESIDALEAATRSLPSDEALVALGVAYFNTGQYQKALDPLRRALGLNPQSFGARQMLGKTYFVLGDLARAGSELEAAFRLAPNDFDVAYTLGITYLRARRFDAAKQFYNQLLKQLGDRPQLRVLIGRAYREVGLLPEAVEEFKRAIALDPQTPRAHYYLGLAYLLNEGHSRVADAEAEFKIELAANPEEFFANYYLGVVYITQRKWDPAIGVLQSASRIQPDNPDPYFQLGQAYQELGRHEQAIEMLRKAIALNPHLAHNKYQVTTAHHRLAQSLLRTGQTEAGKKELQLAEELKAEAHRMAQASAGAPAPPEGDARLPEVAPVKDASPQTAAPDEQAQRQLKNGEEYYSKVVASAHNHIGLLRAERQDYPEAARQFASAARWDPRLEGVNLNLGLAYYRSESYREAVGPLEREVKANPAGKEARWLLGLSYFMTDDYPKASELLHDVAAAHSTNVALYHALASSLLQQGKREAADRVIQQMRTVTGDTPQLHLLLGQARYAEGDAAGALDELKAASAAGGMPRLAHYYSGLAHLKLGRPEEATREFERELALNPHHVQAKYHLATGLLARREFQRGVELLREVIRARPDFTGARSALGAALLRQGDSSGAIENLAAAARLSPDDADVHDQLGRAYLTAGRKAEGESHLKVSRELRAKARGQTNR